MGEPLRRAALPVLIIVFLGVVVAGLSAGAGGQGDRAYELEQRLRCPVCKTVSIADSTSETAVAMREAVAEQVEAGRSDQEIIVWFTERYGDWVLMDPPASGKTLPLWLLPLGVAAAGVVLVLSRRRGADPPGDLSPVDRERVSEALAQMRAGADEDERL